jgi:aspartate 1-decarboxylase
MIINMLKSKIHYAKITDANIAYQGSIGIDADFVAMASLREHEKVDVYNITNGQRFSTYVIIEPAGSRTICLNGAAARLGVAGDKIIIAAYCWLDEKEAETHKPVIVLLDGENNVKKA